MYWALAGAHLRLQDGAEFGNDVVLGVNAEVRKQEIVFIGMRGSLNEAAISNRLDECLLSEQQCRMPETWAQMPDPIVLMPNSWQELDAMQAAVSKK